MKKAESRMMNGECQMMNDERGMRNAHDPMSRLVFLHSAFSILHSTFALGAVGLLCAVAAGASGQSAPSESVILAGRMVAPDGSLVDNVAVVVADGKIKAVKSADEFSERDGIIDRRDAVLCPGLIDAYSVLGAYGQNIETVNAIDPAASVRDSIDAYHRNFRAALRAGVTTALICPAPNNLVGGVGVVVRPDGTGSVETLRDEGPLLFALGSSAQAYSREPTSRMGALHLLRDALERARDGEGHGRLVSFAKGELSGMVICERAEDVSAALRTFGGIQRTPMIVHTAEAADVAEEIADHNKDAVVLVGPYTFGMSPRVLSGAAVLSNAGVNVVFAGRLPAAPTEGIRLTAALAVRYGMDAKAARAAMTSAAAQAIGVGDRVGSIAPGMDADFVVFSGDPLRMDSRVVEVYIKGVRVPMGMANVE